MHTATVYVKSCPRCGNEINVGDPIEVYSRNHRGKRIWSHSNCSPMSGATHKSVKKADPVPTSKSIAPTSGSPTLRTLGLEDAVDKLVETKFNENVVIFNESMDNLGSMFTSSKTSIENKVAGLESLLATQGNEIDLAIKNVKKKADSIIDDQIEKAIEEKSKKLMRVVHTIKIGEDTVDFGDDEILHECFDEVLMLLANGFPVFLPGPTGCGKTHMAEQCSRALGVEFAFVSGSEGTTESEIVGTTIPNVATGENVFVETPFIHVFENGGLFLVDEADGMDANCLLKINSAVANGLLSIPKRKEKPIAKRHEKFYVVMAANTYGRGASREYCGRNRLDEATLDRFRCGTVEMDYCEIVEKKLCPNEELYNTLVEWRQKIYDQGVRRIMSTRFFAGAYKFCNVMGQSLDYVRDKFTSGWTKDEIDRVFGS